MDMMNDDWEPSHAACADPLTTPMVEQTAMMQHPRCFTKGFSQTQGQQRSPTTVPQSLSSVWPQHDAEHSIQMVPIRDAPVNKMRRSKTYHSNLCALGDTHNDEFPPKERTTRRSNSNGYFNESRAAWDIVTHYCFTKMELTSATQHEIPQLVRGWTRIRRTAIQCELILSQIPC